eukprot:TRINITY_DN2973_c0_g2_i1.p1 TRINITY_DN2973_c0_g2~~TRINITY_DN2973_c0_g2_i1.p1  ORF type:complete len:798 (+),score=302.99 TRINITY_DN2973_c0_g2_i1:60-2396(+)
MPAGRLVRCCSWIAARSYRAADTEDDRGVKAFMVPVYFGGFLTTAVWMPFWGPSESVAGAGLAAGSFIFLSAFLLSCCTPLPPRRIAVVGTLLLLLFFVIPIDWRAASVLSSRFWVWAVIALDVTLLLQLPNFMNGGILGCVLLWLFVERLESVAHFGLYDMNTYGDYKLPSACDCSEPPCGNSPFGAASIFVGTVAVFVLDFYFTRRFAVTMREQLRIVRASVAVSNVIAHHLARYDVDKADVALDEDGAALPPELRDSFRALLANLKSYRPFLSDSLLLGGDSERSFSITEVPPPGRMSEHPDVCIVFTDVQSSTALWEATPQGMFEGLQVHNSVARDTAASCAGYEVKVIGDAFMLAFADAAAAVGFCLRFQSELVGADWPTELCMQDLCRKQIGAGGNPLWHGLRVRCGVHHGEVRLETNPITGRCDYFGSTVNLAARVEAQVTHGGLVGVTSSVLEAVRPQLQLLGDPAERLLGMRVVKGVRDAVQLHVLVPRRLQDRFAVMEAQPLSRQPTSGTSPPPSPLSGTSSRSRLDTAPVNKALTLRLRESAVTVCCVRVPLQQTSAGLHSSMHQLLHPLGHLADKTQGAVVSVLSAACVVVWNANMPCPNHVEQAFRFGAGLHKDFETRHVGGCSGRCYHGNIAGARRKFPTVVGGPVDLAVLLAGVAEACQDDALVVGTFGRYCKAMAGARPVHVLATSDVVPVRAVVYAADFGRAAVPPDDERWMHGSASRRSSAADEAEEDAFLCVADGQQQQQQQQPAPHTVRVPPFVFVDL